MEFEYDKSGVATRQKTTFFAVMENTTKTFLQAAREFVSLLEDKNIEPGIFYSKAHTALIDLYAAGNKLNTVELKYSSVEEDYEKDIQFEDKNANIVSILGKAVYYWEVFDPSFSQEEPEEPIVGWLEDDFRDIYKDLKIGLLKIDTIGTDAAIEDALWQLKWGFTNHWGNHAINAMRYLHFLNYDGKSAL